MTDGAGLQFERAEFENAPLQTECAECKRALAGFYFDVNGRMVCEACRYAIEAKFNSGSAAGRIARATGAGLIAAALGAALYYGIAALTGYEFGLIAIVVGFAVGSAVNWGSNGRGGWAYQTLAIALTYFAIVSTYIPPIVEGLRTASEAEAGTTTEDTGATASSTDAAPGDVNTEAAAPVPIAGAILIILLIACAAPFLAGFENIIGLVIIGIGLYEAWKLNRRIALAISGPHTLVHPAAQTVAG